MKKIVSIWIVTLLFTGSVFAAPLNDLDQGETAAGMVVGSNNHNYYIENNINGNFIAGMQSVDGHFDIYGQVMLDESAFNPLPGSSTRLIVGGRSLNGGDLKPYVGVGARVSLVDGVDVYASGAVGHSWKEAQVGIMSEIGDDVYLNMGCRAIQYDSVKYGVGVGITYKI